MRQEPFFTHDDVRLLSADIRAGEQELDAGKEKERALRARLADLRSLRDRIVSALGEST